MNTAAQPKAKRRLQDLSSGSKIGVQGMWLITLVILPLIFPNIIQIQHRTLLAIDIIFLFATSILFEILTKRNLKNGKDNSKILNIQLLTSVVTLTLFLHLFGRINGPFFILYLLTVMESALNLNAVFPNIVVGFAVVATVTEFFYLVGIQEISFGLYTSLQLLIRIVSLFFMRAYGISLAQRIILEANEREKLEKTAAELAIATEQIQETNEKLEYVDKLKDEFVSLASHELRTPMTAIKSYTWLIINGKAGPLENKAKEYLNRIYISTERLIRLVNEMLNISRIESGKVKLNLESVDIKQLIGEIQKEFQPKAEELGLTWTAEVPESLPHLMIDREKIHQVFENLIDNALKYTNKGGSVRIRCVPGTEHIEFSITDTGKGIHPADMPKLFSKFGRLEGSYVSITGSGSGLGLYISKQYVELHRGKIWAYSDLDKGSTFVFTLPLQ
jgi:signal transduction histidine kinase